MIQSEFEGLCRAITESSVADCLGFVVESFDGPVINPDFEVVEDVLLVAPEHPGEVPEGLQSGMRRPPEPPIKILFGAGAVGVVPKSAKSLFQ